MWTNMMKRLIYQVYVGGKKFKLYDACIDSVKKYCEKYDIDHVVQTQPILRIKPDIFSTNRSQESYMKYGGYLPIYEKENAFSYFKDYDQIAIVDADIFIKDSAPNIFKEISNTDYDFAAMCEREAPIQQWYKHKLINYTKMQYSTLTDVDWKWNDAGAEFFNMGLMVMNKSFEKYLKGQTPQQFLNRYEFKRFVDGEGAWKWSTDQTLLNWWIKKEKIKTKHLDWRYNSLYTAIDESKIRDAHFVHFFLKDKLPNRGENVDQLLKDIYVR